MPAIDIDREIAHEAAQRELNKPIYPRPSLTDRVITWLDDTLSQLLARGSEVPGGWFTLLVLGLLVLIGVIVAARIARRTMGSRRVHRLYGAEALTASDYRRRAEAAAAQRDWDQAIRQRLRAIARQLEEDDVLPPTPGRTAGELARDAGGLIPALAADFSTAAEAFNDVTYGGRPGEEPGYRVIARLDEELRRRAAAAPAGGESSTEQQWAAVR